MEDKLNFLLMGKTGQGKSATGNYLLCRRFFKTSPNSMSETKDVNFSFSHFGNYTLQVVDGPGLEDTAMTKVQDKKTAAKHMDTALAMCYGGIDAFLFVMKFGNRFTAEDKEALEALKKIFGDTYIDHVIVVMTCGDLFQISRDEEELDITFLEWCQRQTGEFKNLYEACKGRFVLFNNREKDAGKKHAQIQELVQLACELRQHHGRYNTQCFKDAAYERDKLILTLEAPHLTLEFQEKISFLTADIERFVEQPTDKEREKIRVSIQNLKCEIELKDKGYGVLAELRNLADKVEANLYNAVELQSLAKKLEETRQSKKTWTVLGTVCTVAGGLLCLAAAPVAAAVAVGSGIVAGASALAVGVSRHLHGKSEEDTKHKQNEIKMKMKK